MISLPKPYEDELLYSVVARAIAYLAPKHDFAVNRLIGRAQCSIFFGLPIDWLDGGIESAWGLSPQEIVERHTMFPFYGRFLPRTQFSAGMEIMLSGSRRNIATNLGLQNQGNVIRPAYLKFCRSCAREDVAVFGETFWRRSHQLNGTLLCLAHNEVLRVSSAAIFRRSRRPRDASVFVDLSMAPECASLTSVERSIAKPVSARCIDFLCGRPTRWEPSHFPAQYRRAAIALHYLEDSSNPKRLSHEKLTPDFVEFYGSELLKKLGCNLEPSPTWVKQIFRALAQNHYHPLLHALVQTFLEYKCADQGCGLKSTRTITDATREWKCPNPYAEHDESFRVPTVDRRWRPDGSIYFRAKCSCGYGFSFNRGTIRDRLFPETTRVFAWGPRWEREARRLRQKGFSNYKIARIMDVSHHVVKRLVHREKNKFEADDITISLVRKEWLKTRSKRSYLILYYRDRVWLRAQRKRVSRGGIGRPKDWSALDKIYAPQLLSTIRTLEVSPRRISYLALEEESGIQSLKKKVLRMPRCSAILAKVFEGTKRGRKRKQQKVFGRGERP